MSSNFSNLKLFPFKSSKGTWVGNGSIVVAGMVEVKFRVVNGKKGIFAALPSEKSNKTDENTGRAIYYPQVKIPDNTLFTEFQNIVKKEWGAMSGSSVSAQSSSGEENQTGLPF